MRTRTKWAVPGLAVLLAVARAYLGYRAFQASERQQLVGSWAGDGGSLVIDRTEITPTQPVPTARRGSRGCSTASNPAPRRNES